MSLTEAVTARPQLRADAYRTLGQRKDTLFELMAAALVSERRATTVRLSLSPLFRRRWARAPAALRLGQVDAAACRQVCQPRLPSSSSPGRPVWALDGSTWPRPAAATSAARTWTHRTRPGRPRSGVAPGWEYHGLMAAPEPGGRWVLPLDVRRRAPGGPTPTALAVQHVPATLGERRAASGRPVVTLDRPYDPVVLAQAQRAADLLVRLTPRRRFSREPAP